VTDKAFARNLTGLAPLDHVLGGGLVVGSVVFLAAPVSTGKTSLTLQMLAGLGSRCLFVTNEETREQVLATAERLGASSKKLCVLAARDLDTIFTQAREMRAQLIAVDSIHRMERKAVNGRPGSPTQLKECTAQLVQHAKTTDTTIWLIGHMTSKGEIAGPKTMQHDVDVVLTIETGKKLEGKERTLRCADKNRFGPAGAVGRFELTDKGFVPLIDG
jgi:DNA repair protein RadA/Sms